MGKARPTSDDQSSETEDEREGTDEQSLSLHDRWRTEDEFARRNGAPRPPR